MSNGEEWFLWDFKQLKGTQGLKCHPSHKTFFLFCFIFLWYLPLSEISLMAIITEKIQNILRNNNLQRAFQCDCFDTE